MKKLLALAMALCMILSLCACGAAPAAETESGSGTAPEEKAVEEVINDTDGAKQLGELDEGGGNAASNVASDETLRVLLDDEPHVLTPQYSSPSSPGITIGGCIFDTLYRWDNESNSPVPCLATDYEWIDDTHIRFTLRDGVVAHDGSPLTAEDVLYSVEFGLSGTNSNWGRIFNYEECEAEDDLTVILATNNSFPNLLDILTGPSYGIISKSATEACGGMEAATRDTRCGFGPYTLESWESGQYVRLVRHDDYWDADNVPYYKHIDFTWNSDTATRSMAVQAGDVDVTFNLTATQLNEMKGTEGISVYGTSSDSALCFYMNCSQAPFDNEMVREAMALAVDREAIVNLVYNGYVSETETNFTQISQYYSAPEQRAEPDLEAAKQLLADAGYPDGFEVNCMIVAKNQNLAQLLQSQFEQIGVKINIQQVEFSAMMGNLMSGDYQTYITDVSSNDPARLLIRLDGRLELPQASGGCQFNDDELNALIDVADYEMDYDTRLQAYVDIQSFIREHHPLIGLCSEIFSAAYKTGLTGVTYDASAFPSVCRVRPAGQ